jgi:hypothetical protein
MSRTDYRGCAKLLQASGLASLKGHLVSFFVLLIAMLTVYRKGFKVILIPKDIFS